MSRGGTMDEREPRYEKARKRRTAAEVAEIKAVAREELEIANPMTQEEEE